MREVDELADEIRRPRAGDHLPRNRVNRIESRECRAHKAERRSLEAMPLINHGGWSTDGPEQHASQVGQPVIFWSARSAPTQTGDTADFVIWNGDPLDTTSRPSWSRSAGERVAVSADEDAPTIDRRRPTAAGEPERAVS